MTPMSNLDPRLNICPKCGQWIAVDSGGLTATEIAKIEIAQLEADLKDAKLDFEVIKRELQKAQAFIFMNDMDDEWKKFTHND